MMVSGWFQDGFCRQDLKESQGWKHKYINTKYIVLLQKTHIQGTTAMLLSTEEGEKEGKSRIGLRL